VASLAKRLAEKGTGGGVNLIYAAGWQR